MVLGSFHLVITPEGEGSLFNGLVNLNAGGTLGYDVTTFEFPSQKKEGKGG